MKGDAYLWDLNGVCIGVECVGGSPKLACHFAEWADRWDETSTANNYETDRPTLAAEQFDEKGLALATELKRVVGDKSKVIYGFVLKEGAVEVLTDGSTREWHPGIDFDANRKRAFSRNEGEKP